MLPLDEDIQDGAGAPEAFPKPVSRFAYFCLTGAFILIFQFVGFAVIFAICGFLRVEPNAGWCGGMGLPIVILGNVAADRTLRRFGRSLSGQSVELRVWASAMPEQAVAEEEVVEVRSDATLFRVVFWMSLLMGSAVIAVALLIAAFKKFDAGIASGLALGGFFVLLAFGLRQACKKPLARFDQLGLTCYATGRIWRKKFIPWSDVAACELTTVYDTFGNLAAISPRLMDREGRTLLTPYLLGASVADQARLADFIKARLPKTKVDLWE